MKILVVDDDQLTVEAITHNLKQDGYDVYTAKDGLKALEVIEHQKVDLIICDIMMPNMSGLGLLSLLKNFYLEKTPVILISSLDQGEVILSSLDLGAHDFIVKPIDFEELSIRVKKLMKEVV